MLSASPGKGKLSLCLLGMLGVLVIFKLYDGGKYLPAGMSFYLFQIAAYLIDISRRRADAPQSLLAYSAQLVMFPKLLSGPLMSPLDLEAQNRTPALGAAMFHCGLQEFVLGLSYKVILANRIGGLWRQAGVQGYGNISTIFAWMALCAFAMQLYFDFHGYSLMAHGLGRMLGYTLPFNFDTPYASKTVAEFYRRWHISLGAWFRDYLYIPLGGSRKGALRTILNLAVVWLFTGLWHGSTGNYVIWAMLLLVLIINERLWLGKLLNRSRIISHVYLVFVILISWVPFAVGDWNQMISFLGSLFGASQTVASPDDFLTLGYSYFPLLAAGLVLATPWPKKQWEKIRDKPISDGLILVLFWIAIFYISTAAQDPFLYFQY